QKLLLHGPFTEIYPAAIDYRARELGMQRLNEAYEVAATLGVTRMIVHNGWLPFIYFKSWQAEKGALFWQAFLRDKPADFELCIENVLEDEPDMLVDMMRQIDDPRIRLCLDIGHANAVTAKNLPVTRWIQRLAPYLAHFHLHNNDGSGDTHAAFDAGSIDMQEILQTIDRCCADDVTYTIEAREPLPCLAWLKAHQYL
ncbi:MAG: sugar phosphate isomerase/epimerase family protein, partial [Clostridia bacterium]